MCKISLSVNSSISERVDECCHHLGKIALAFINQPSRNVGQQSLACLLFELFTKNTPCLLHSSLCSCFSFYLVSKVVVSYNLNRTEVPYLGKFLSASFTNI